MAFVVSLEAFALLGGCGGASCVGGCETEYKQEQRERIYTVYMCVPEVRQMTREYAVMVLETHTNPY